MRVPYDGCAAPGARSMPPVGMMGGRYGGAGYSHVLDAFMVLFNHFISCGVWEAVAMLDGFLKNTADIPPEILHAETQGQRTPVCGLAPLLGMQLRPHIRHWKDRKRFRPTCPVHSRHRWSAWTWPLHCGHMWELAVPHLPS